MSHANFHKEQFMVLKHFESIHLQIIELLSIRPPSVKVKMKLVKGIAEELNERTTCTNYVLLLQGFKVEPDKNLCISHGLIFFKMGA
jgi:hypothetical protein